MKKLIILFVLLVTTQFTYSQNVVKYRILEISAYDCPSPDIELSFKKELNKKNEWELIENYHTPRGETTSAAKVKFKILKPGYYKIVVSSSRSALFGYREATGIVSIGFKKKNIIKKSMKCSAK